MDRDQFDVLARVVSARQSRRTTLASLLGAVVLGHAPDVAATPKGKRRNKRKRKQKNRDQGSCYPGRDCIPGQGKNNAGCDFSDSTLFRQRQAQGSQLKHTNFSGADLTGANLQGADLEGACLAGADLRDAVIDGSTKVKGAIFCNTRMPDGSLNDTGCDRGTRCCPICDAAHPCGQGEVCCAGRCVPGACCGNGEQGTCGDGELCCEGTCRDGVWANETTFGSRGPAPDQFQFPQGVAVSADERTLWVADTASQRISIWTKQSNGAWTNQTTFGSGGPGPGQFSFPFSVAVADDERTAWVADSNNHRISVWTEAGGVWSPETAFGSEGDGPGEFDSPNGVAVAADGKAVWVADTGNARVSSWRKTGGVWAAQATFGSGPGGGPSQFDFPTDLAVAADEKTVWVADSFNHRVSVWSESGGVWSSETTFGSAGSGASQFAFPAEPALAGDERTVWVADRDNDRISIWTRSGGDWVHQTTFGGAGSGPSELRLPEGLAVAADGQAVWVADRDNHRISIWSFVCPVA